MKSDLSKVKVGDRIWTISDGWTKVEQVIYKNNYPIMVSGTAYDLDGKLHDEDAHPSAFTFNPFEHQHPFEGYWAMVSRDPITEINKGVKRFVFMEKNGRYFAWNCAESDEEVAKEMVIAGWDYANRIPEPAPVPEYTVEELTKILGYEFKIKK